MRVGCAGPIPVELLRWKFVEGRTVELKYNARLELPANIGELGDSVEKIDLSWHRLRGETPTYDQCNKQRDRAVQKTKNQHDSRGMFLARSYVQASSRRRSEG